MRRRTVAASAAFGAAAAVHLAPALLTLRSVRVRVAPGLAGIGSADHVALTFDDGPDPNSTPAVLDALDRLGWKATFFLLGSMIPAAGSLPAEIVAEGHEVAVHGDLHRSHLWRTLPDAVADVQRARDAVIAGTDVEPRWFRPPYGTLSAPALAAGRRAGLRTVLWTAWGRDWRPQATPQSIVDDVLDGWIPGATVLLHDSDCTSAAGSWRRTVDALPRLADAFASRGVTVGPLRDHGLA